MEMEMELELVLGGPSLHFGPKARRIVRAEGSADCLAQAEGLGWRVCLNHPGLKARPIPHCHWYLLIRDNLNGLRSGKNGRKENTNLPGLRPYRSSCEPSPRPSAGARQSAGPLALNSSPNPQPSNPQTLKPSNPQTWNLKPET